MFYSLDPVSCCMQRVIEVAIALVSRLVSYLYSQIVLVLRVLLRKAVSMQISSDSESFSLISITSPIVHSIVNARMTTSRTRDFTFFRTGGQNLPNQKKKMAVWTPDKIAKFFWVRPTTVSDKVDQVLSGPKKNPDCWDQAFPGKNTTVSPPYRNVSVDWRANFNNRIRWRPACEKPILTRNPMRLRLLFPKHNTTWLPLQIATSPYSLLLLQNIHYAIHPVYHRWRNAHIIQRLRKC